MLTQEEQAFIQYWKANRLRRKKTMTQFLIGIPIGLAFVIPIVINFASGWYRRADMEANSQDFNPMVLLVALLLIVGFTAIFYQRHQWDQREQYYRELLAREDGSSAHAAPQIQEAPSSNSGHPSASDSASADSADGLKPAPDTDSQEQPTKN